MPPQNARGRPKPVAFSGLFLPSYEWEMKIEGVPVHEMEHAAGERGTLLRYLRRQDASHRRIAELAISSLRALAKTNSKVAIHLEAFEALAKSDAPLTDEVADRLAATLPGYWGCFSAGARLNPARSLLFISTYVEIEQASVVADAALASGDYGATAEIVRADPTLQIFWCEESLQRLASAQDLRQTLSARLHAWVQLQLCVIAQASIFEADAAQALTLCGTAEKLLGGAQVLPGVQWLKMAKQLTGASSLTNVREQLLRDGTVHDSLPSEATIKRWSRGSVFPQQTPALQVFVKRVAERAHIRDPAVSADQAYAALAHMYRIANRLQHTHWFALQILKNPDDSITRDFAAWHAHHLAADDTPCDVHYG